MSAERHIGRAALLASATKLGTMSVTARSISYGGGPVRAGTIAMAVPREETARARLLDQAIGQLLRGEEPSLGEDDELSDLLEVARLRYRLSRYLRHVAAARQQAVWGQVRFRLGLDAGSGPAGGF